MVDNKTKLINNIENFLLSPKGYKKSWVRSFIAIVLCAIAFATIIGLSYTYGPLSGKTSTGKDLVGIFSQTSNANLLKIATYMSISGIVIMLFPFICALATWMIGINQAAKSKYFHLLLWFLVGVAAIMALVCIILIIRASIFNQAEFPATPPPQESNPSSYLIKNIIFNNMVK